MAKQLPVDPKKIREPSSITLQKIPVNQYKSDIKAELKRYGKDRLKKAYYDMALIREFETMLDSIKKEGVYQGITYNHKGFNRTRKCCCWASNEP